MIQNNYQKHKIIIFLAFLTLLIFLVFPLVYSLSDHLSKTKRVKANILLVEGWLTYNDLEIAYQVFREEGYKYIITTGIRYSSDYYMLSENGYLIFYIKNKNLIDEKTIHHTIEIDAYSELNRENSAHFNLFVNDSLIADFIANKHKKKYSSKWEGSISGIDSIMVQFTNDGVGSYGDRNMFVKEIIIDQKYKIPYQNNSIYNIDALNRKRRIVNNFFSFPELARNRLLSMGIDSSQIIAIPCKRVRINRTLTSALAFKDWIKTSDIDIHGINIISKGTHAKRTWMSYNKILGKKYDIGVVSIPDLREKNSWSYKVLKTIRETIGVIYYWIILIPY
jgi:hypothetical protein